MRNFWHDRCSFLWRFLWPFLCSFLCSFLRPFLCSFLWPFLCVVHFATLCVPAQAEEPSQAPQIDARSACPFKPGEKIRYEIRYGLLKGGDITLEVRGGPEIEGSEPWHLVGRAVSSKLVSVFYEVDDGIEGWVAPRTFLPQRLEMTVEESGERGTREVVYDRAAGIAHYKRRREFHKKHGPSSLDREDELHAESQDALSFLYFLRCVELTPGAEFTVPLHENGKNRVALVKVGRPEEISIPLGDLLATPLELEVTVEGKLANKRALMVWIGEGPGRVPVRFEADLKFGKLKGLLAGYRLTEDEEVTGGVEIER